MVREIDFKVFLNKNASKVFKFENDDSSNYDFNDSTSVILKFYKDPDTPLEINGSIDPLTAEVTFVFLSATHTDVLGNFEYVIEDTKSGGSIIPIGKGNIIVENYIPFSNSIDAFLVSELPANLSVTENFTNQRLLYWRLILQKAFNISDEDLETESAWPKLVNILFAKLVVYDALMLAATGSFVQFLGGSFTDTTTMGSGGIKSVETGPTKVEYYDTATSAKNALTAPAGGSSMFDILKSSICGLSNHLKVKLPMCEGKNIPIHPKYYQNPAWDYLKLDEMDDHIESVPSQG